MGGEIYPVDEGPNGIFDAAGTLTVFYQCPSDSYVEINRYSVITDDPVTGTVFPIAKVYLGEVGDTNFLEGTYSGNLDASDGYVRLERNQKLTCVWTGGTTGRKGTFSLYGKRVRY